MARDGDGRTAARSAGARARRTGPPCASRTSCAARDIPDLEAVIRVIEKFLPAGRKGAGGGRANVARWEELYAKDAPGAYRQARKKCARHSTGGCGLMPTSG